MNDRRHRQFRLDRRQTLVIRPVENVVRVRVGVVDGQGWQMLRVPSVVAMQLSPFTIGFGEEYDDQHG